MPDGIRIVVIHENLKPMKVKPVSPTLHGINDYALAAILMIVPEILCLNKKAKRMYKGIGANILMYNAVTDHPVGFKPVISESAHRKIDLVNLAGLALSGFHKEVRKDGKALAFHAGVIALAVLNTILTDWEPNRLEEDPTDIY